jgi:molybdenum cofactor cytidylyltransferase
VTADRVTGVVLAAGRSTRLGTPKQLLPYAGTTLLGATLEVARHCPFDQLIVTLGGAADDVRAAVGLARRRCGPPSPTSTRGPTGSC